MEQERWQWQEPGKAWKGAGLYHITLTVTSRRAVLGALIVPDNDAARAYLQRSPLGDALVDCLLSIPQHHPEVRVLHFCLMPDHLHAVLYVQRTMAKGIGTLVRGFWQAAKKLGRACSVTGASLPVSVGTSTFITPNGIREELKEGSARLKEVAAGLRQLLGDEAYYNGESLFEDMPFIRPMGRYSQLPNTIRYLDMNPQRLATKRLKPGFFRVQQNIVIGSRSYNGVGNIALLTAEGYDVVHVRSMMVRAAEQGEDKSLRDYMNSRVLLARKGKVMVSPFVSPQEKQVLEVLLREQHLIICLADNGFREYYKPVDMLFDACASGRLLILSPWPYDSGKRHISRADCVALNQMAEDICSNLSCND